MTHRLFEKLASDEFAIAIGPIAIPSTLRRALQRKDEVRDLRKALSIGAVTENSIRDYVSQLMSDLQRGQRFPHEIALAAISVVLETRPTNYAEEFLLDLSQLRLAELSVCIRIARLCTQKRFGLARNRRKVEKLSHRSRVTAYFRVRRKLVATKYVATIVERRKYMSSDA